ncbi:putative proline-rich receptor-like protein kinase PERK8 [Iris pallida]|uniref:Proline-rich receptor-like protein kinase PERK8 n=1 Tax=Iris pallida TaxID=29817 RepID=A0AAX6G661_IRIPA|nr:putative proline-rich receptor-like protein kinase PERK8 [Iris pallida]
MMGLEVANPVVLGMVLAIGRRKPGTGSKTGVEGWRCWGHRSTAAKSPEVKSTWL